MVINIYFFNLMGSNKHSKPQHMPIPLSEEWETIDHLQDYNIVRNRTNGFIGQSKKFRLDPLYEPENQIQIYRLRGLTQEPIVRAYGAELVDKVSKKKIKAEGRDGMCMSNNYLHVITERIVFTLGDLPQLSFLEGLYVLRESLRGYEHLFLRTGPAHVNQNKIGFNSEGKARVWINQEWYLNYPSQQIHSLQSTRNQKLDREYNFIAPQYRDEKEMVENIIDVVEGKSEQGYFPNEFSTMLRERAHSFMAARNFVNGFIRDRSISIPESIHRETIFLTKTGVDDLRKYQGEKPQRNFFQTYNKSHEAPLLPQRSPVAVERYHSPIVHFDSENKKGMNNYHWVQNEGKTNWASTELSTPAVERLSQLLQGQKDGPGPYHQFPYAQNLSKMRYGQNSY